MVSNGATTNYTYDAANRLLTATPQTSGTATTYTYDNAGNLLSETCGTATVGYSYTADNQLAAVDLGLLRTEYTYYPGGLRKTKSTRNTNTNSVVGSTQYVWNGSDLVLEDDGTTATKYFYGLDLYGSVAATGTTSPMPNYYFHDAHGNVSRITSGITVTHTYLYDAFGNQLTTVADDTNPFRYCGEYYDSETENYYLRARYYDPGVGRFTQQDTHWNTANMIYGDTVQKLNVTVDAEGGEHFTAIPQLLAIRQAGNLYGYCANNPVMYADPSGNLIISTLALLMIGGAVLFGTLGGIWGYNAAEQAGLTGWDKAIYTTNSALFGGIIGSLGGYVLAPFVVSATGITSISILSAGEITSAAYAGGIALKELTQRNFRTNLQIYTGFSGIGYEAHHVFPVKFVENFKTIGIDIHNPLFGAWVNPTAHHSWSYAYNKAWFEFFFNGATQPTFEGAIQLAKELAQLYGYSLNFW